MWPPFFLLRCCLRFVCVVVPYAFGMVSVRSGVDLVLVPLPKRGMSFSVSLCARLCRECVVVPLVLSFEKLAEINTRTEKVCRFGVVVFVCCQNRAPTAKSANCNAHCSSDGFVCHFLGCCRPFFPNWTLQNTTSPLSLPRAACSLT